MLFHPEADENVTDRVRAARKVDAPQKPLAPAFGIHGGGIQLLPGNRVVDRDSGFPRRHYRHRGQAVVVTRHALGFFYECHIRRLQQRQAFLNRGLCSRNSLRVLLSGQNSNGGEANRKDWNGNSHLLTDDTRNRQSFQFESRAEFVLGFLFAAAGFTLLARVAVIRLLS
jgi:hypothetical protein